MAPKGTISLVYEYPRGHVMRANDSETHLKAQNVIFFVFCWKPIINVIRSPPTPMSVCDKPA